MKAKTNAELDAEVIHLDEAQEADTATRMQILPSPSEPMAVARQFVQTQCLFGRHLTLRYWCAGWWSWKTQHWAEIPERAVKSVLWRFTEDAMYLNDGGLPLPWRPNKNKIANLMEALVAVCLLDDDLDQPCWLDGGPSGDVIVSTKNGLLDVARRKLMPHTPEFFNQTSVPFDYDAKARKPERWLKFLDALWPNKPDEINLLSEWFGYVISGRTDLHKILLIKGPTRGGKGAIARVLTALVGKKNTTGPTLNSLSQNFGLAPLIGKPLAVVSDARFAGRDASVVVERLLSISGEDTLTVDRKYRDAWCGKLPTRLHVLTNELPKLGDASAAVVGRFVLLLLTESWFNREDRELEPALHRELSGILNWSLDGLQRLTVTNKNRFTRLPSAEEAITQMRDLASPVSAFVREQCELGANLQIAVDDLYAAFKVWNEANGYPKKPKHVFGRDLMAAFEQIRKTRPWAEGDRPFFYTGIDIRQGSTP